MSARGAGWDREARARAKAFAALAREYCAFVAEAGAPLSDPQLDRLRELLARLYAAGLGLPAARIDEDDPPLPAGEAEGLVARLGRALPVQYYWTVLEPFAEEPATELGCGDLIDDLADVHRDLAAGLALLDAGAPLANAVLEWRTLFDSHWGAHAVDALRVLHELRGA